MNSKKLLVPQRRRQINGSFAFIPHSFLRDGFVSALSQEELALYLFFVLAADKDGLSYYSSQKIGQLLKMRPDVYELSLSRLIKGDLICLEGRLVQVLQLPPKPIPEA